MHNIPNLDLKKASSTTAVKNKRQLYAILDFLSSVPHLQKHYDHGVIGFVIVNCNPCIVFELLNFRMLERVLCF